MARNEDSYERALFEATTIGLALCRMDGELVDVNKAYAQLLGRNVEETLQLSYWDITPIEYAEDEQRQLRDLENMGKYGPYEKEYIHKNGHRIPVRLSGAIVENGGDRFIWSTVEDITDRKNAVEALQKAHDSLDVRVKERTVQLNTYAKRLERSNQDFHSFAYLASHDLQEPLRKIITFGDRLIERSGYLEETDKNYLQRIQKAALRMRNFINDLLEMSKVEATTRPLKLTILNDLIKDVLEDMEDQINKTKGKIYVGSLPDLEVDPIQFSKLLQNLISNSLKYHRDGIPPIVRLNSLFNEKINCWEISVEDNGIGFDEIYLNRIFKPFERLHGKEEYEGTGIGLAICEKIAHSLEGNISAKSKLDEGTTFVISLPKK
jgi:PAS domain S-box-containing protein